MSPFKLLVIAMAFAFLMLAIYATPEQSQAITDKQIEEHEIKQFEELSPDETKTTDKSTTRDTEEDSSSEDSLGIEEESADVTTTDETTKIEENEKKLSVPSNEDEKGPTVPDNINLEQDTSQHTMKPLVSGLIDDLQRRTRGATTGSADPFKNPTHRKHTWGGRGLERRH